MTSLNKVDTGRDDLLDKIIDLCGRLSGIILTN